MAVTPFHLRYTLSRSQRLVPHLRLWGTGYAVFAVLLLVFFGVEAVASLLMGLWNEAALFSVLALGVFLWVRGLIVGLVDVLRVPVRQMDVLVEQNAAAVLVGEERWYLFLDGIIDLRQFHAGTWTLQHFNGAVLHIPVSAISEEQIAYLRSEMERGRTPEGMRNVVERGRRIEEIRRAERRASPPPGVR